MTHDPHAYLRAKHPLDAMKRLSRLCPVGTPQTLLVGDRLLACLHSYLADERYAFALDGVPIWEWEARAMLDAPAPRPRVLDAPAPSPRRDDARPPCVVIPFPVRRVALA